MAESIVQHTVEELPEQIRRGLVACHKKMIECRVIQENQLSKAITPYGVFWVWPDFTVRTEGLPDGLH